jgi:hypothetical protein
MYKYLIICVCFRSCGFNGNIQIGNVTKDGLNANEQNNNDPEMAAMIVAHVYFRCFLMNG